MIGQVRDKLNQAPPWVSYTIAGVVLAAGIGLVLWQLAPEGAASSGDKHFICEECEHGYTVTPEEARGMIREAAKQKGEDRGFIKCPKCNQHACVHANQCPKCKAYFAPPERSGSIFPDSWRDECPDCGYSAQKEKAVAAALKRKKEGKYDPNGIPEFIRKAVEEAEESGEYDEK